MKHNIQKPLPRLEIERMLSLLAKFQNVHIMGRRGTTCSGGEKEKGSSTVKGFYGKLVRANLLKIGPGN